MSKFELDLKKFKHVSSDEESHTLRHYQGHEIKIAKKALSAKMKGQLEDMANKASDKQAVAEAQRLFKGGIAGHPAAEYNANAKSKYTGQAPEAQSFKTGDPQLSSYKAPSLPQGESAKEDAAKKAQGDKPVDALAQGGMVGDDDQSMGMAPPVQKFANGGVTMDPNAIPQQASDVGTNAVNSALSIDPAKFAEQEDKRQLITKYNEQITNSALAGNAEAGGQFINPDNLAGTSGNINPNAMQAAKAQLDQQRADQTKFAAQQQADDLSQTKSVNDAKALLGLPATPLPGVPADQSHDDAAMMQNVDANPAQPFPQPGADSIPSSPEQGMMQGYQMQMAGNNASAKATAEQGQRDQAIANAKIQNDEAAVKAYNENYAALEQERQNHIKDIQAGYINPEQYWKGDAQGNGGHSKIAAVIGMILAGFNPTGRPNAAMEMMKYQMDKNMDAQRANLGAKENLLAHNLQQFGNMKDAMTMTRIMQNDAFSHQLMASAAQSSGPKAMAAAQVANGALMQQNAQLQYQFGLRRAMMSVANGAGGNPSNTGPAESLANMLMASGKTQEAKALQERIVPGVGVSSSQPVPQDIRNQLMAMQNFGKQLERYKQFATKHSGSLNPSTMAEGKALAAELQGAYRQASNGGVYKEGEQHFIEKLIPEDPTQMLASFRTNPKIKELMANNMNKYNQMKQSYGLPVLQTPPPDRKAQAMEFINKNPDSAKAKELKKFLGIN